MIADETSLTATVVVAVVVVWNGPDTHITVAIIANNGCGNADADLVELMLTG